MSSEICLVSCHILKMEPGVQLEIVFSVGAILLAAAVLLGLFLDTLNYKQPCFFSHSLTMQVSFRTLSLEENVLEEIALVQGENLDFSKSLEFI